MWRLLLESIPLLSSSSPTPLAAPVVVTTVLLWSSVTALVGWMLLLLLQPPKTSTPRCGKEDTTTSRSNRSSWRWGWGRRQSTQRSASSSAPTASAAPTTTTKNSTNKLMISVPLGRMEDGLLQTGGRTVSTLTWLAGDYQSIAPLLQQRLRQLVQHNPWLLGRIVPQRRRNGLQWQNVLVYPDHRTMRTPWDDDTAMAHDNMFQCLLPAASPFGRQTTPMSQWAALARQHRLIVTPRWHQPVYRVSVVPCRHHPQQFFCLVVSLSHVVGDGHTFYALYNYLLGSTKSIPRLHVKAVNPVAEAHVAHTLGARENHLIFAPSFLLPTALSMLWGKLCGLVWITYRHRYTLFVLDADKVQQAKEAATAAMAVDAVPATTTATHDTTTASSSTADPPAAAAPFCSTNDVLASWFFSHVPQCSHGFMAVNLRGRIPGYDDPMLAGNYWRFLYYALPRDTATPALLRRSVTHLRRASAAPTAAHVPRVLGGGSALLTNWATFCADGINLGSDAVRVEWHCPLFTHASLQPYLTVAGVLFKIRPHEVAFLAHGSAYGLEQLRTCPLMLQDQP